MEALNRALLHCLKYSGQDVYGLLMSSQGSDDVSSCVPLFHTSSVTVPLLRSAFEHINELGSMNIVGIYFASNCSDVIVTPVLKWILDEIPNGTSKSAPLVYKLDVTLLTDEKNRGNAPFRVYRSNDGKFIEESSKLSSYNSSSVRESIQANTYTSIVDFEDYLNNPNSEWIVEA